MGVQVNGKTSSPFGCHPLSSVSLWDFLIPPTCGWLLPSWPEWLEGKGCTRDSAVALSAVNVVETLS